LQPLTNTTQHSTRLLAITTSQAQVSRHNKTKKAEAKDAKEHFHRQVYLVYKSLLKEEKLYMVMGDKPATTSRPTQVNGGAPPEQAPLEQSPQTFE